MTNAQSLSEVLPEFRRQIRIFKIGQFTWLAVVGPGHEEEYEYKAGRLPTLMLWLKRYVDCCERLEEIQNDLESGCFCVSYDLD